MVIFLISTDSDFQAAHIRLCAASGRTPQRLDSLDIDQNAIISPDSALERIGGCTCHLDLVSKERYLVGRSHPWAFSWSLAWRDGGFAQEFSSLEVIVSLE